MPADLQPGLWAGHPPGAPLHLVPAGLCAEQQRLHAGRRVEETPGPAREGPSRPALHVLLHGAAGHDRPSGLGLGDAAGWQVHHLRLLHLGARGDPGQRQPPRPFPRRDEAGPCPHPLQGDL